MSLGSVLAGFKTQASALGLSEEAYLLDVVLNAIKTGTMTDINAIYAAATGGDQTKVQNIIDAIGTARATGKAAKSTAVATSDVTAVAAADAATIGIGFLQADVQSISTLANALKAQLNLTVALVNELKAKINTMNA